MNQRKNLLFHILMPKNIDVLIALYCVRKALIRILYKLQNTSLVLSQINTVNKDKLV